VERGTVGKMLLETAEERPWSRLMPGSNGSNRHSIYRGNLWRILHLPRALLETQFLIVSLALHETRIFGLETPRTAVSLAIFRILLLCCASSAPGRP
jgi:hypothetical protein